MRLDGLSVRLRARTAWEAADLGQALVRRHARTIWTAWFAASLPVWLVFNALAWLAGKPWIAAIVLWWLKPAFDRIPLHIIARATFGPAPGVRETLCHRPLWRARSLLGALTWRRLQPARSLRMPVEVLEGLTGAAARQRGAILQRAVGGPAIALTLAFVNLEGVLYASGWVLALMFVPFEYLDQAGPAMWKTFFDAPPMWAQVALNAGMWLATSLVEPFYVGAGFGLYLNRRVELEAWDVELEFRRLAARLRGAPAALLLALALVAAAPPAALAAPPGARPNKTQRNELRELVGSEWRTPDPRFAASARRALADPLLGPTSVQSEWAPNSPQKADASAAPAWMNALGRFFGFISDYGAWILAGLLLALVLWRLPGWWRAVAADRRDLKDAPPVVRGGVAIGDALPDDVAAAARQHWQAGDPRAALALLFRASVRRLETLLSAPLPPGATEAECLRRARRLGHRERELVVVEVIRAWQTVAYAHRAPSAEEFESLLERWRASLETAA